MSANHSKKPHRASSEPAKRGYKFERLIAWQKAMNFCVKAYEVSMRFPRSGCGSDREFSRFLSVALRSQYEVVTILRLAERLGYLTPEASQQLEEESSEVGKLIQGLKNSLSED